MKRARQNGHRHTCDCGKKVRAGGPWTMHTRSCDTYREAERKREVARLARSTERLTRR